MSSAIRFPIKETFVAVGAKDGVLNHALVEVMFLQSMPAAGQELIP
jgi:hypothetical protein